MLTTLRLLWLRVWPFQLVRRTSWNVIAVCIADLRVQMSALTREVARLRREGGHPTDYAPGEVRRRCTGSGLPRYELAPADERSSEKSTADGS